MFYDVNIACYQQEIFGREKLLFGLKLSQIELKILI